MVTPTPENPHGRGRFDSLVVFGEKKSPVPFTDEVAKTYLMHLATTGAKLRSAAMANTTNDTVLYHRKHDPDFDAACKLALEIFAEKVAAEVHRRGVDGWCEPVYQKGQRVWEDCPDCKGLGRKLELVEGSDRPLPVGPLCGRCDGTGKGEPAVIQRYSERMLELLAKAHNPHLRDKTESNVTVTGGVLLVPAAPENAQAFHDKWRKKPALEDANAKAIDVTEESKS